MKTDLSNEILQSIRRAVTVQLWQLGAIKVNLEQPFKLTSGNFSPIYINCRQLISSPAFVDLFSAAARILVDTADIQFDIVAGGETAGIPFAAFLASNFGQPMVYVRKEVKGHGIASRIEGASVSNKPVLLVEDLITDAGSKISFVNGIQEAGGSIRDIFVIFDRQQGGEAALHAIGIRLHTLSSLDLALQVAKESHLLNKAQATEVHTYLDSPSKWHLSKSLPYHGKTL